MAWTYPNAMELGGGSTEQDSKLEPCQPAQTGSLARQGCWQLCRNLWAGSHIRGCNPKSGKLLGMLEKGRGASANPTSSSSISGQEPPAFALPHY